MTPPRQVLPGTTYLITRRCSERRFFLRPSEALNAIFLYVLALAAQRFHMEVHAFCVLSNHYHLLVTDPEARLPAFMQYLDSLVARATNALLGRWEGLWSSGTSYSAVTHGDRSDLVRKFAYVLANPVSAGLVRTAREWPGLWTAPEQLGSGTRVACRPDTFFGHTMPETVELRLTVPPGFENAEDLQSAVRAAAEELEEERRREFVAEGRVFATAAHALAQSPFAHPRPGEPRRQLKPRVAARDKGTRIEALSRLEAFVAGYRVALARWRAGVRDVVFPAGTYQLRLEHAVHCAAASG
jgi:putative transposase